jgi:transketolase
MKTALTSGSRGALRRATLKSRSEVLTELTRRARAIRRNVLAMGQGQGRGYVGQGLALADLMAALYFYELRIDPVRLDWPERDRLVLSTAHSAIAIYAALTELGVYSREEIIRYGQDGSPIDENPTEHARGFEITGGSLGQGLSQAVGMALGARLAGRDSRIYCLVSDGELQEGQVWEAAMAASHYHLDNIVTLVDFNGIQADGPIADVMQVEPIAEKFQSFGWAAQEVDAHNLAAIVDALDAAREITGKPVVLVCRTIMCRGVPSLERRPKVHYIRLSPEEWETVIREFEEVEG